MAKAGTGIMVTGDRELDAKLKGMPGRMQLKLSRKATRRAARGIILPDARAMAPVDTGALEKSLVVKAIRRSRTRIGHSVQTKEGFFQGEQFYGGFQEFGTKTMRADPFLRPALYSNETPIKALFVKAMKESIKEEAVKV